MRGALNSPITALVAVVLLSLVLATACVNHAGATVQICNPNQEAIEC